MLSFVSTLVTKGYPKSKVQRIRNQLIFLFESQILRLVMPSLCTCFDQARDFEQNLPSIARLCRRGWHMHIRAYGSQADQTGITASAAAIWSTSQASPPVQISRTAASILMQHSREHHPTDEKTVLENISSAALSL